MTSLLERLPESSWWLMILVKMTALLAAAWMAHWLLLGRNPRWRVMLWRGVMAGLVVLPVLELAMPAMQVEVPSPAPRMLTVAAGHLRNAADIYERMASDVLTSRDTKPEDVAPGPWDMKEGQTWRAETRAEQVRRLKAALPLEQEAIGEIAKALEIEKIDVSKVARPDSGKVKREGETVRIEEVENPVGWGQGQENTFLASLGIAPRAIGEKVDYDYLMGVSGQAFRTQIHQPNWCASAPDAACGFNTMLTAMEAVGYS